MSKISWKPGTMLFPVPPVMVTCGTMEEPKVLTIAWTGIISSEPPMTYISVRPSRHSHETIKESGEFVINITTLELAKACDYCGVKSGKSTDKFKDMELEIEPCQEVKAPMLKKAPVSLECKVKSVTNYGTHDMFLAEIVNVNIDDKYLEEDNRLALEKAGLLAFAHGRYYTLGRDLGAFGFSVDKTKENKTKPRKSKFMEVLELEEKVKEGVSKVKEGRPSEHRERRDDRPARRDGERRPYSRDGGERRAPRRDGDGERRPFNRDGGERRAPRRDGDGERRPYNRDGGERRAPRRDGDGERRPFNRDGGERRAPRRDGDGERRPYNRDGGERRAPRRDGDGERRPFNRDGGERRAPRRDGDGERRPYNRDGGNRRPSGDRPYRRKSED